MLALIACIIFVLAAFSVHFSGLNMIALGLSFLAAHLIIPWVPWNKNGH